jgi:hypothetical protein
MSQLELLLSAFYINYGVSCSNLLLLCTQDNEEILLKRNIMRK